MNISDNSNIWIIGSRDQYRQLIDDLSMFQFNDKEIIYVKRLKYKAITGMEKEVYEPRSFRKRNKNIMYVYENYNSDCFFLDHKYNYKHDMKTNINNIFTTSYFSFSIKSDYEFIFKELHVDNSYIIYSYCEKVNIHVSKEEIKKLYNSLTENDAIVIDKINKKLYNYLNIKKHWVKKSKEKLHDELISKALAPWNTKPALNTKGFKQQFLDWMRESRTALAF